MFKIVFVFFFLSLILSLIIMAFKGEMISKTNVVWSFKAIVLPVTLAGVFLFFITLLF